MSQSSMQSIATAVSKNRSATAVRASSTEQSSSFSWSTATAVDEVEPSSSWTDSSGAALGNFYGLSSSSANISVGAARESFYGLSPSPTDPVAAALASFYGPSFSATDLSTNTTARASLAPISSPEAGLLAARDTDSYMGNLSEVANTSRETCNTELACISSSSLGEKFQNCGPEIPLNETERKQAEMYWHQTIFPTSKLLRLHKDRQYWREHAIPCIKAHCEDLDHCRILEIGGQWYNVWSQDRYLELHPKAEYWVVDPLQTWEYKRKPKRKGAFTDPMILLEARLEQETVKCKIFQNFLQYRIEDVLASWPQFVGFFDVVISFGLLGDVAIPFTAENMEAAVSYMNAAARALANGGILLNKLEEGLYEKTLLKEWAQKRRMQLSNCGGGFPWDSLEHQNSLKSISQKSKRHAVHTFVFFQKNLSHIDADQANVGTSDVESESVQNSNKVSSIKTMWSTLATHALSRAKCPEAKACFQAAYFGGLATCGKEKPLSKLQYERAIEFWRNTSAPLSRHLVYSDRKYWRDTAMPCVKMHCTGREHCRILEIGGDWYNVWSQDQYRSMHPNVEYWVVDPAQVGEYGQRVNSRKERDDVDVELSSLVKCKYFQNFVNLFMEDLLEVWPRLVGYFDIVISYNVGKGIQFKNQEDQGAGIMLAAIKALRDDGKLLAKFDRGIFDKAFIQKFMGANGPMYEVAQCGSNKPWETRDQMYLVKQEVRFRPDVYSFVFWSKKGA